MKQLKFKNKWQKFWWEVFSEDEGKPSSKRIIGAIMILCTQVCLIIEFALHGSNSMVCDLFQVNLIIGASLLGISNITAIWKGGRIGVGNSEPILNTPTKKEEEIINSPAEEEIIEEEETEKETM
jgi:hypothetical protein